MKLKIYFEASWRDGSKFGVAMDLGETERPIDCQMLAGSIDKGALLRACGLDGAVRPEGAGSASGSASRTVLPKKPQAGSGRSGPSEKDRRDIPLTG